MTKKILITSLFILGGIALANFSLAASIISFSPNSFNLNPGESFNLTVSLDPQGVRNYTVKNVINYPADLLEVTAFNFAANWMQLSQSGYDLIDNTNGQLIKTAGYPGGIPTSAVFGTVTFLAKQAGSGMISLSSDSAAYDASNQNVLSSSLASASVNVEAVTTPPQQPVSQPETAPADSEEEAGEQTQPEEGATQEETTEPETEEGAQTEEETVAEEDEESEESASLLASIGDIITFGTGNAFIGILILLIAAGIIFFIIRGFRMKKRS